MRKKRKKRFKIIFIVSLLIGFSIFFVSEPSKTLEEMYFKRFEEGYKEGFIAGEKSGFVDGYTANRYKKRD